MPDITTSLTVAQLRTASKAAIISDIASTMTKLDLIVLATGTDKLSDTPVITRRKDGQMFSQSEVTRDIETDAVLSSRDIYWTYYKDGEVDEITIIEMDSGGKEISRKIIKHYLDGRQPELLTDKIISEATR